VDRIKRLSYEVLEKHKSKFGESFEENKKTLDSVSIIRSKGLKNEIAGFITKFLKKEAREQKKKQAQIESEKLEIEDQTEIETVESDSGESSQSEESETSTPEISEEKIDSEPETIEAKDNPESESNVKEESQ